MPAVRMGKISAGIVMWRHEARGLEVLLVHPGGPFWAKKDEGAWSFPKGEVNEGEDLQSAARREFSEEMGSAIEGELVAMKPAKLKSGKVVYLFAVEGDFDVANVKSNLFEMEWPPRSGKKQSFPEVDRAAWFGATEAKQKLNTGLVAVVGELAAMHRDEG